MWTHDRVDDRSFVISGLLRLQNRRRTGRITAAAEEFASTNFDYMFYVKLGLAIVVYWCLQLTGNAQISDISYAFSV